VVPVRGAFSQQIGQVEQPFCAWRGRKNRVVYKLIKVFLAFLYNGNFFLAEGVHIPVVRIPRGMHGTARGIEIRIKVYPGICPFLRIKYRSFCGKRNPGRGSEHITGVSFRYYTRANASAAFVSAANNDRRSFQKPCFPRRLRGNGSGLVG